MTSVENRGRLGNHIIRSLAVSFIAEKFNLQVYYYWNIEAINNLGIYLFSGTNLYEQTKPLTDLNYFSVLNDDNLNYNLDPNNDYFQTKDITNLIYSFLNSEQVKQQIIFRNPYQNRYNANNDLYIHIRLDDVAQYNPGLDYYLKLIKTIVYDKLYISTDEKAHAIVQTLISFYPDVILIEYDEINTIQFASTCKNIILSHGSFSAVIGYLAFFSSIYYQEYEHPGYTDYLKNIWYGDMFSIPSWNKIKVETGVI